jgi:hypothetical protein
MKSRVQFIYAMALSVCFTLLAIYYACGIGALVWTLMGAGLGLLILIG